MAKKKKMRGVSQEVQVDWESFWKETVCDSRGRLSLTKVMKELYDYGVLQENAASVFYGVTDGRISKPFTSASTVISVAEEVSEALLDEILHNALDDQKAELVAEFECEVASMRTENDLLRAQLDDAWTLLASGGDHDDIPHGRNFQDVDWGDITSPGASPTEELDIREADCVGYTKKFDVMVYGDGGAQYVGSAIVTLTQDAPGPVYNMDAQLPDGTHITARYNSQGTWFADHVPSEWRFTLVEFCAQLLGVTR